MVTARYALTVRLRLTAVIPGGSAAAADEPRYLTGLTAELAAATAARPADPDRVAAAAWRILGTLGEATFALTECLGTLARLCRPAGRIPDVPDAAPDPRRLAAALGGAR